MRFTAGYCIGIGSFLISVLKYFCPGPMKKAQRGKKELGVSEIEYIHQRFKNILLIDNNFLLLLAQTRDHLFIKLEYGIL